MVNCAVVGCKSRSEQKYQNVTFHRFPNDATVCNIWRTATGRQNWLPNQHTRICSKHFERHCFRRKQQRVFLDNFSVPILSVHNISMYDRDLEESSTCPDPLPVECQLLNETSLTIDDIHNESSPNNNFHENQGSDTESCISLESTRDQGDENEPATVLIISPTELNRITTKSSDSAGMAKTISKHDDTLTPRERKLTKKLKQKTFLAESRKKKLAAMTAKIKRLRVKNAELSAIIEELNRCR